MGSTRNELIEKAKGVKDSIWAGDGRFDSMGHSAKYGAYSVMCPSIGKIVHFELVLVQYYTYFIFNCINILEIIRLLK